MRIRLIILAALGLMSVATCSHNLASVTPSTAPLDRPNIILILADDVGVEAYDVYGGTSYQTPNMRRLADMGTTYLRAFSQPLCTPTRVELMTGQPNEVNYQAFGWLAPTENTFGQELQSKGYRTAIAGKWQLSAPEIDIGVLEEQKAPNIGPHQMRDSYGFDEYSLWQLNRGLKSGKLGSRYWDPQIEQNGELLEASADDYGPDLNADFLISFMNEATDENEPFFAYFPTALPHDPWVATPHSNSEASRVGSDPALFKDNIEYLDHILGRLIDFLETKNILDQTLIIFLGDNGTSPLITSDTNSGPIQGGKGVLSLRGTHVPLIISGPGIKAGMTDDRVITLQDLHRLVLGIEPEVTKSDGQESSWLSHPTDTEAMQYFEYDSKGKPFPPSSVVLYNEFRLYEDGRVTEEHASPNCCIRFEREVSREDYPNEVGAMEAFLRDRTEPPPTGAGTQ